MEREPQTPLNNPQNVAVTDLKKEPVNCKLTVNQPSPTESYVHVPFSIKIPLYIYRKYAYELTGFQKKLVRDAVKQFIASLVLNAERVGGAATAGLGTGGNINFNVVLNVNSVQTDGRSGCECDDSITRERVELLERKLREARELVQEYRAKAQKFEAIVQYVREYKRGVKDARTLLNDVLQLVERELRK